jgi:hypothetical protein
MQRPAESVAPRRGYCIAATCRVAMPTISNLSCLVSFPVGTLSVLYLGDRSIFKISALIRV